MGHLDRYKKAGGFSQLLQLIESFASAKQEKFLALIEEENPVWAKALREKMLTVARISTWPPATLAEIFPHMNTNLIAIAFHGMKPEQVEHFLSGLPAGEKRKIQNEFDIVKPQPQDIATTHYKMVEAVRRLVNEGSMRLETIDPSAVVNEKTEEALLRAANNVRGETAQAAAEAEGEIGREVERPAADLVKEAVRGNSSSVGGASAATAASDAKSQALVVTLQKEIKTLRAEVKVLKDKLEAIRKIA
ncbi:MAG: FliG C-terminal domain-containing protein [Bdellovibrionales bacterium]